MDLVQAPGEHFPQDRDLHRLFGEADDVHGGERTAAHSVDVAEGIDGGYLPEREWVIDDGREEIDCLDERKLIGQLVDPGVLSSLQTGEEVGVGGE